MSEFEDKLNHILSDPQEMEKISRLAAQLMGGSADGQGDTPPSPGGGLPDLSGILGKLGSTGGKSDKAALLSALSPYLSPDRRQKLQKALRLAQAARIAGVALEAYGGDGSV